jgi:sugar lactone lactonase YvrE
MNPDHPVDPLIGALRIANGRRLKDAAPHATSWTSPAQAARDRDGERLFILLDVTGPVSPHFYRELREVVVQTYWSSSGSVTAALRLAAAAANRRLLQANAEADLADRYYGGLICAVFHGQDLFILQAGPTHACYFRDGQLKWFSQHEDLSPLGKGPLADVRVHHVYVTHGDQLLLASPALMRTMDDTGLGRVLAFARMEKILEGLEQVGGAANFSAMVVRWPLPGETAARETPQSLARLKALTSAVEPPSLPWQRPEVEAPTGRKASRLLSLFKKPSSEEAEPVELDEVAPEPLAPPGQVAESYGPPQPEPAQPEIAKPVEPPRRVVESYTPPPAEPLEQEDAEIDKSLAEQEYAVHSVPASRWTEPAPRVRQEQIEIPAEPQTLPILERPSEPGPGLGERIGEGARAAGRGAVAVGGTLAGGMRTLFRRMLPGPEREARQRARSLRAASRPIPKENRSLMITLAIGIPLVLAVTIALTYVFLGTDARFRSSIRQAEEQVALAQALGGAAEASRPHWEAALKHADAAAQLRSGDPVATSLQAQARAALDLLDGIIRLYPILLKDFGAGAVPRQLVVHGQMIFVLDPAGGWASRVTLNPAANGVLEQEGIPSLVRKEQSIGDGTVDDLVDLAWVDLAGGRQTSGLLILERDGALVSYDPAWEGEGGVPQFQRSFLGTTPDSPAFISTYEGRLYVLDTVVNQIRRYEPRSDNTYPDRPDHYFVLSPPRPLTDVLDMAIDGRVYLLYNDGAIHKFLRGELESFEVRGVPGDLSQAIALAIDPDGSSGVVYVADRGNRRVIALEPDGGFRAQFRADEAFDALEALAVDEAARRIYAISGGRLYVAPLP